MSDNAKAMVWASFIGDALALGPHWEYDTAALAKRYGRVTGYITPDPDGYHGGKKAGDLTHYGDQTLVLLDSLADRGCFDLDDFARKWLARMRQYEGYMDGATRMTLKIFDFGENAENSGSNSNDLAGASRVAPVVYALKNDLPGLVAAVRAQTKMTHNHAQVIEAAEFMARTAWGVLAGQPVVEALQTAAQAGFASAPIERWLTEGMASADEDTITAIGRFGRTCHIGEAMPGVLHLLARYTGNLPAALTENVMAGGDSAARGMLVGMILGAAQGMAALPPDWLTGLTAKAAIEKDLVALRR